MTWPLTDGSGLCGLEADLRAAIRAVRDPEARFREAMAEGDLVAARFFWRVFEHRQREKRELVHGLLPHLQRAEDA